MGFPRPPPTSPPEELPYETTYGGWWGAGCTGSAQREVLGTEVLPPAQQAPCWDELQRHRPRPLLLQVPLKDLQGKDGQSVCTVQPRPPHPPAPSTLSTAAPPHALTSKAVTSSSGAMLTSGTDSAWLMALAALDTSG